MTRIIIGHALTFIVAPTAGYVVGKYVDQALGATVMSGVAGLGGILLHLSVPGETLRSQVASGAAGDPPKP
jgi:hypothetical protein